jgi:hypothetical protein
VETVDLKLVGVQCVIDHDEPFVEHLHAVWAKVLARLDRVANVSAADRAVAYWHFIDNATRLYFAGVQVDSLEGFVWDYEYGLVAWEPGPTTFAMFREADGEEGTITGGVGWKWLAESAYRFDSRFIGDFEAFSIAALREPADARQGGTHEVWIPVVPRRAGEGR